MPYRRSIFCSAVAVAALLVTAGCTAVGLPTVHPSQHKTATVVVQKVTAEDRFRILHRPFAASDALPADTAVTEASDIVLNSQRRAGSDHGTTFWIAETTTGGACLIAANPDPASADTWTVCSGDHLGKASQVTGMSDEGQHGYLLATDGYAPVGANPPRRVAENVWAD